MNLPLISVIIPTYNREQVLRETISEVLQQNYPNFEVIVVDQTQTHEPETQTYLDQLTEAGKIQYYRVTWASLPGARNYAVRRSQGDIILFIDDDVQLPEGYLFAHAHNYISEKNPQADKIGAVA